AVPCGNARFFPMWVSVPGLQAAVHARWERWRRHVQRVIANEDGTKPNDTNDVSLAHTAPPVRESICLLPGPVTTYAAVREAFYRLPISHRTPEYIRQFENVRRTLGKMVGDRDVALLNGSGTLANETVAAPLAAEQRGQPPLGSTRGLLLV